MSFVQGEAPTVPETTVDLSELLEFGDLIPVDEYEYFDKLIQPIETNAATNKNCLFSIRNESQDNNNTSNMVQNESVLKSIYPFDSPSLDIPNVPLANCPIMPINPSFNAPVNFIPINHQQQQFAHNNNNNNSVLPPNTIIPINSESFSSRNPSSDHHIQNNNNNIQQHRLVNPSFIKPEPVVLIPASRTTFDEEDHDSGMIESVSTVQVDVEAIEQQDVPPKKVEKVVEEPEEVVVAKQPEIPNVKPEIKTEIEKPGLDSTPKPAWGGQKPMAWSNLVAGQRSKSNLGQKPKNNNNNNSNPDNKNNREIITSPTNSSEINQEETNSTPIQNPNFILAEKVKKTLIDSHNGFPVGHYYVPHNFKNPGQNNCFINACIHALFACRPFVTLLQSLPHGEDSTTPVHNTLRSLLSRFTIWNKEAKTAMKRIFETEGPGGVRLDMKMKIGIEPLDPRELTHQVLVKARMDDGKQHDAQEFLSFLINGLNDEYVKVMKMMKKENELKNSKNETSDENSENNNKWGGINSGKSLVKSLKSSESSDSWEAVTSKTQKRTQKMLEPEETLTTKADISPISKMFNGTTAYLIEECNKIEHKGNSYANSAKPQFRKNVLTKSTEPYLCLGLDLVNPGDINHKYKTVYECLDALSQEGELDGYVYKDRKVPNATRRLVIDDLPTVLVLHLKRFAYDFETNESHKLHNDIEVPAVLTMPKSLTKQSNKYNLFAIIYHHGQKLSTGHYTADVKTVNNWWCGCDDERIWINPERNEKLHGTRTPYLLLYLNEMDTK